MTKHADLTPEERARRQLDAAARDIEQEADTDATTDVRAGALPREGVPNDVPDTQESLDAEDGAYRIDEVDETKTRGADPKVDKVERQGLRTITADEL